jgi:hypothetical protein
MFPPALFLFQARGFVLACLVAGVASATHAGTSNSAFMQEGAKDPNLLKGTIWDKTLVRDVTLATDMAPVSPLNTAEAMGRCEVCVYVIENKEGHQPYLCRGLRDPHYQQTVSVVFCARRALMAAQLACRNKTCVYAHFVSFPTLVWFQRTADVFFSH